MKTLVSTSTLQQPRQLLTCSPVIVTCLFVLRLILKNVAKYQVQEKREWSARIKHVAVVLLCLALIKFAWKVRKTLRTACNKFLRRSSEHSDESPCLSGGMNETLLTILRNQAECVPELVAVHFSGKKKKCNLTPHSYTLPNDTGAFLATTVGKALPRATVEHVQRRMSYWLNQDCDKSSQALRNATLGGDPELTELVLPIHSA